MIFSGASVTPRGAVLDAELHARAFAALLHRREPEAGDRAGLRAHRALAPLAAVRFGRCGPTQCTPVVLFLKNLAFTVLFTGAFVGWLPLRVFERHPSWPASLEPSHWAALALGAAGLVGYLHCQWLFMRKGQGTPFLLDPPRKLVQRGAYRWVRNPMYLSVLAIIGAEGVFLPSTHIAIYWVCLVCLFQIIVMMHEERDLSFRFGAMYEDYKRAVPRWLPRRPRRLPAENPVSSRER